MTRIAKLREITGRWFGEGSREAQVGMQDQHKSHPALSERNNASNKQRGKPD